MYRSIRAIQSQPYASLRNRPVTLRELELRDEGVTKTIVQWTAGARAVQDSQVNELFFDTMAQVACQLSTTDSQVSFTSASANGSMKELSVNRFACLFRHWKWSDEAMAQFDRELATGWEYNEDPLSDRPFGAYYHWCALLCGFAEAALDHGLLSRLQLDAIRDDLEASLPTLQACRQLLVVIPGSLEEHPRIVALLHDDHTLGRLRRIHCAFGNALRQEWVSRELELLLYEH